MNNKIMCDLIDVLTIKVKDNSFDHELCWKKFYEECIHSLRTIVHKKNFTFDADWTQEDFEHDVMLKVIDKIDSFDAKCGHFSTWFTTISTRIYYKKFNRVKVALENGFSTIPIYIKNDNNESINVIDHYKYSTSVEQDLFHNLGSKNLCQAIVSLKDNYRDVVILCDLQGLKPSEASKHLGCKSEDVSRWLSRAHASLKSTIIKEEIVEDLSYEYEL